MAYKDATTLAGTIVADMTPPSGEAANVAWIKNGEPAIQTKSNRPHQALAENCDFLRAAINRDIGLPVAGVLNSFAGGASIDIDPSGGSLGDINYTGTLYLGESGWAGQERLDQLFQILDENYQEVSVGGVEAKVTSLSGNPLGGGFVSSLTALNLNVTLPAGNYRIGHYEGTDLENLPPWALTHAGLRGLEEVSGELKEHKARLEIGEITLASPSGTIDIDPTAGAGGDYDLSPAGFVYLGGSAYTGGGAEEAGFLFQILDENYNTVVVDGAVVTVSSTSPVLGSGFYNGGNVTLTLSDTLPSGNYRLLLARNDSVAELADDALVKGMTRYAHRHPSYEAFTAVLTDGTNSTGGDYNGPNSIDNLDSYTYGGRFLLKRGVYEWSSVTTFPKKDMTVIGELLQWGASATSDVTSIYCQSSLSTDFDLSGHYENVFFGTKSSSWGLAMSDCVFKNVKVSPGTSYAIGEIYWSGGSAEDSLSASVVPWDEGFYFSGAARGVIEGIKFVPPPSGAQTCAVSFGNLSNNTRSLQFVGCTFDSNGVAGAHALKIGTTTTKVIFEGCTFIGADSGYCVNSTGANVYTDIVFKNCHFENDYGYLVNSVRFLTFENCTFETGNSHKGGSITAVNTTTETFTLAGDHSALVAGDKIRVVGSTGNDGYWTVVSTSGTGPTDITVSEDVTDATADGTIRYSDYTQVFVLKTGLMRDCVVTLGEANIIRGVAHLPVIELGSNAQDDEPVSTGSTRVDGLDVICSFDTVPHADFIYLWGGDDIKSSTITGVNTGTETFTVSADFSELSLGDKIEVYGSTGNDGYWTVVSTSGLGPTNITVAEDVTDATVDGFIRFKYAENTGSFNNIRVKNIPPVSVTRGSYWWVHMSSNWLSRINHNKATIRNMEIELQSSTAAVDGIADNGGVFSALGSLVDGLSIDAASGGNTTGSIGLTNGVVAVRETTLRNLHYCTTNAIHCTSGGAIIRARSGAVIDGGNIYRIGNGTSAADDLFELANNAAIKNLNCGEIMDWPAGLHIVRGSASPSAFENNFMDFDDAITSTTADALFYNIGTGFKFVSNTIHIKRTQDALVSAGSSGIIDSNIANYLSGGGDPASGISAVGSTVGDNEFVL